MRQVHLHRPQADKQALADARVAQTTGGQPQDLPLPLRQELPFRTGRLLVLRLGRKPCQHLLDDGGMENGLAGVDRPHGPDDLCGRDVLQQVTGGACRQKREDVLVVVVLSEDEYGYARPNGLDPPCSLDAAHHRHGDVHYGDIGVQPVGQSDRLGAVRSLPHDLDVRLLLEELARRLADKGVVLCDYYADLLHTWQPSTSIIAAGSRAHHCGWYVSISRSPWAPA